MADDEPTPFGHPNFYAPIWQMLRDAAKDPDCHAYTDELLFAANEIEWLYAEIERLRAAGDQLAYHVRAENAKEMYTAVRMWEEARRER